MSYSGRTVLVTGAAGFLGWHLTQRLSALGGRVHRLSRPPGQPDPEPIRTGRTDEPPLPPVDLRDSRDTQRLFETLRPEVVFHLASASGGSAGIDSVLPHLHDDVLTTVNCLLAAQATGVGRIVIPGSLEEFCAEDGVPESPYALAKSTCVQYARMFHRLYGTPAVICRIFMTYGPGQKPRKIVPHIVRAALAGASPRLLSEHRLVDWIYVDDTIDALLLAGSRPGIEGEIFEIGSGRLLRIGQLAARIGRLVRGEPPGPTPEVPADRRTRAADLTAAREQLGWQPTVPLDQGLRRTIDWYRAHPPA